VIGLGGAVGMPLPDRIVHEVALQASFLHHDVKRFLGCEEMPSAVLHRPISKKSLRRDRDQVVGMLRLAKHVLGYDGIPAEVYMTISGALHAAGEVIGK
jgi:hypothetical protein